MSAAIEYAIIIYAVNGLGRVMREVRIVPGMTAINLGWLPFSPIWMGQETWDRVTATVDRMNRRCLPPPGADY